MHILNNPLTFMCVYAASTVLIFLCSANLSAQEVILSSGPDPLSPYSNAEILPVGSTTVIALRTVDTGEPVYTFTLENENLVQVTRVLANTLLPPVEITSSPLNASIDSNENFATISVPAKSMLNIQDGAAYVQEISFSVNEADINAALGQTSIASNCNIYIEGLIVANKYPCQTNPHSYCSRFYFHFALMKA